MKARFSEYLDLVSGEGEQVTITRNGQPAAVLLGFDEFERMRLTLDILSDPRLMQRIRRARADVAAGRGVVDADGLLALQRELEERARRRAAR